MPKLKDRKAWLRQLVKVVNDPAASDWLKETLMEAVDREPLEAEQDAEVVFKICQLRAAVVHGGSTVSAATDKSAVPRRKRSVAKGTGPSDIAKYTDQPAIETPRSEKL
jgi:hypothetical protein